VGTRTKKTANAAINQIRMRTSRLH